MAPYRDVSLEEEEPLTGADGVPEKWSSKFSSNSLPKRLARVTPYWPWIAHGVLLSLSLTFFALSLCIRSAKHGVLLDRPPETYCKSIRKSPPPRHPTRLTKTNSTGIRRRPVRNPTL